MGVRRRGASQDATWCFRAAWLNARRNALGLQVFSSDSTLWWSPTSAHLAFVSFNESEVPVYEYPVYNQSPSEAAPDAGIDGWEYPKEVGVRYPKVRAPAVRIIPLA